MAIHKIYPNLICAGCGNELVYTEPETKHVFTLKVVACPKCAAQQSAQWTSDNFCALCGRNHDLSVACPADCGE